MKIALVSIGDEVLNGFTVNSNAAFVANHLLLAGYPLSAQYVLPDHPVLLAQGLQEAMDRHDMVLCMGGLGPTADDRTRGVVADLFQSGFRYDEDVARDLKARYGKDQPSIEDQATVPEKASVILNHVGTAPGLRFQSGNKQMILLPGVPAEMKAMFLQDVLPHIQKQSSPQTEHRRILRFFNVPEVVMDPYLRQIEKAYPRVKTGIYPSHGLLTIHLITALDGEQLDVAVQELSRAFHNHLFNSPSGTIEDAVQQFFTQHRLTLSIAESCTGGSIAARLTHLPGASQYFLGSVVAYSNKSKQAFLDVDRGVLDEYGAISEQVVHAMVAGALKQTGSDYALAVSGVAGPSGGSLEKPVGTVWYAIGRAKQKSVAWKHQLPGNRSTIITHSVNAVLGKLLQKARMDAHD